jgi:hypothetical protein
MSIGITGTNRLANININTDVDIFYHYRPTRNATDVTFGDDFKKVGSPTEWLSKSTYEKTNEPINNILGGIYTLNLPMKVFNKKGIYTVLITPKKYFCQIADAPAVLSALPDVRGIVLKSDINGMSTSQMSNMALSGWRVEYYNNSGQQENYFRIITSNNFCQAVMDNLSTTSSKSISYRFTDSANLIFCTLSPSSSSQVKAMLLPYIGETGQQIALVNTKFNSQLIEIDMVDTDLSMIATLLNGNQALNLDKGLMTTYNDDHTILCQTEIVQVKDAYTNKPTYTLRQNRDNIIDKTESWNNTMEYGS